MRRVLRTVAKVLLVGMLFTLSLAVNAIIIFRLTSRTTPMRLKANDSLNTRFPIVVISTRQSNKGLQARIVFKSSLGQYISTLHTHSFVVPPGGVTEVNRQLAQQVLSRELGFSGPGRVEILKVDNGAQYLKVTAHWGSDRTYTGWYVATQRSFQAEQFLCYSLVGHVAQSLAASIPVTIVLWAIGFGIYRLVRSRRALS